ncbi:polysaccharide biosynthesis tyrosine autokinase [Myxococcota bacterium]|nr:polysaccharide biosynthesis tyrosine autokinase [Myxococcota bacterium]
MKTPTGFAGDEHIQIWRVVRAHRLAILLVLSVVVAVTAALTWRQVPVFRAVSTIRIEPAAAQVVKFDDVTAPVGQFNRLQYQHFYQTQYEILKSRSIAEKATQSLREDHGVSLFPDSPDAVTALLGATRIEPVPESQLVTIEVEHPDPKLASLASVAIGDAFIEQNLAARLSTVEQAARFLDRQFEEWKHRRLESEKRLLDYKEKQDIFDLEDRQTIAVRHLTAVSTALDDTRRRLTEAETRYRKLEELARTPEGRNAMPALLEMPAMEQLLSEHARAELDFERAKARYGENWPTRRQAEDEMAATRAQLDDAIQRAVDTAKARYELLSNEMKRRVEEVEEAKVKVTELARRSVDLGVLSAEVLRNEKFFETLDTRRAETDISALLRNNNVTFIDRALVPERPVRPVWALNIVLALILGLCLGVATALGLDYLDNTIKSPEELESFGIAHLGAIPSLAVPRPTAEPDGQTAPRLPDVVTEPRSPAAECYRVVRTNLRFVGLSRPTGVLVVTSASPREGKSTTAANLGATVALGGQRVLLVDSDLRRPCLHKIFGVRNTVGLTSVFMGEVELEDAIQETGVPGLYLLTSGPLPPNPAEALASAATERLIEPARRLFDLVLCDSSPVLAVTDPVVLASQSDGILFVVRHSQTTRDHLRAAWRALSDVRDRVIGFVMNDLDTTAGYYPYHYVYYSSEEGDEGRGGRKRSPRDRAARAS